MAQSNADRRSRRFVRVGDIITIQSPDMGFISASGVTGLCRADLLEHPVTMPPNLRESRFQVWPQCRYVCYEALQKQSRGSSRRNALKHAAEAEKEHNQNEFESLLGTEVRHGSVIQLLHLSTGKFLTAGLGIASVERDCQRVSLEIGDEKSGWIVTPILKYQKVGDPLQCQEDLYLESAGFKRMFLHISDASDDVAVKLHDTYVRDTYEVNCALNSTRLRILPYRDGRVHAAKEQDGRLFQEDIVSVQLREHDSVLVSHFSNNANAMNGMNGCESNSVPAVRFVSHAGGRFRADAIWKVENEHVVHAGDVMSPDRSFRLKHVASGQYLALDNPDDAAQSLCLTSDYHSTDGRTLWQVQAVDVDVTSFEKTTPLYIRSMRSMCWLTATSSHKVAMMGDMPAVCAPEKQTKGYVYIVPAVEGDDTSAIDRARTFRLQLQELICLLDNIEMEDERDVALQEYNASTQHALGTCIRLCVGGGNNNTAKDPLVLDGEPCRETQLLLLEVGLLDAVVDLIDCLARPFRDKLQTKLCFVDPEDEIAIPPVDVPKGPAVLLKLAYWLLRQVCKQCFEVKAALANHLDMFIQHVPLKVFASDTVRELFQGNRGLLTADIDATKGYVQQLARSYLGSRRSRALAIFQSICICDGAPFPFVQNFLVSFFLKRHPETLASLFVSDKEDAVRITGDRGADDPIDKALVVDPKQFSEQDSLLARNAQNEQTQDPQERVYLLMICTLDFFAVLTAGRNELAGAELLKPRWGISRNSLLSLIKEKTYPCSLRCSALKLFDQLYIEGIALPVPTIEFTYIWSEAKALADSPKSNNSPPGSPEPLSPHASSTPSGGSSKDRMRNLFLKKAKQVAQASRMQASSQYAENSSDDSIVRAIVIGLQDCVKELKRVAVQVLEDAEDESPGSMRKDGELVDTFGPLGERVGDIRLVQGMLHTLFLLANFGLMKIGDEPARELVAECTDTLIDLLSLPIGSRPMQHCKIAACQLLQRIFSMRINFRLGRLFAAYERHHAKQVNWATTVMSELYTELFEKPVISAKVSIGNLSDFVDPLLRILFSAVEMDLKSSCMQLLFWHTGQRAVLVREAQKVTILAQPEAVKVYYVVKEALAKLEFLLPQLASTGDKKAHAEGETQTMLKRLTELVFVSAEVVGNRRPSMAILQDTCEGHAPDIVKKHQDVMRDLGVHRTVLQILRLPLTRKKRTSSGLDEPFDPERRNVLRTAYDFLCLFVEDNAQNQELLFKHIKLFTSHIGVAELDASSIIAATIRNNTALVSQIQESDLRRFVQAIAKYGKRARWLSVLESVLQVGDNWIIRNQGIVMALVMDEQDKVLELDGDQGDAYATDSTGSALHREGTKSRLELMVDQDQRLGMKSFLLYHQVCVTLLAFCCAGRHAQNQQICRTLIPVRQVIKDITSCDHDTNGLPHPDITKDTIRFIRAPFVQFLHHCFVDSAPHDLFSGVDDLWSSGNGTLIKTLCDEIEALAETLERYGQAPHEHADFVFCICLPFFAQLVKDFAPRPLPESVPVFVKQVERCCTCMQDRWQEERLQRARRFFSDLVDFPEIADVADNILLTLHETISPKSKIRKSTEIEEKALEFRRGFDQFRDAFAWSMGVSPTQTVGNGLRDLVKILADNCDSIRCLADVISREAQQSVETLPFLLNCIRAIRGYLCGIHVTDDESNWEAFLAADIPTDPQIRARQEIISKNGVVGALINLLSHSYSSIVREALLALQLAFVPTAEDPAGEDDGVGVAIAKGSPCQHAFVEYISEEFQRRHVISTCAELLRRSLQDLKDQEKYLEQKREQRSAKRRAQQRHGEDSMSVTSGGTAATSPTAGVDADDFGQDEADAPPNASGHTLELLTWLGFCLHGGRAEMQNLLFPSGVAVETHQEDVLAELVHYLKGAEQFLSVSFVHKNKKPLLTLLQAFVVLEHVIRGPNLQAVESMVSHTDIITTTLKIFEQLRLHDRDFDDLKMQAQETILNFILTMLQNLSPDQIAIARKWISNDCPKVLLSIWDDTCTTCNYSEEGTEVTATRQLRHHSFLYYSVLSYLSDCQDSTKLHTQLSQLEAYRACEKECAFVEVARDGGLYKLRFQVPDVVEELMSQETFTSSIKRIVSHCVETVEEETARPALFQERISALLARSMRQRELSNEGFRGFLLRNQNILRSAPLWMTLIINFWILCFESLIAYTPGIAVSEGNEACVANGSQGCSMDDAEAVVETVAVSVGFLVAQVCAAGVLRLAALFHLVLYGLRFCLAISSTQLQSLAAPSVMLSLLSPDERCLLAVESLYVVFSLMGNLVSPFSFATHILEFFGHESARMLLSAATLNISKLGQAGLLIIMTVYVYAVVGYHLFPHQHGDGKCSTLVSCSIAYLDGGLKGDGIHEALEYQTPHSIWDSRVLDWFLQLFSMTFLIIIVQVLMAIFSGIIIDSFGELRDRQSEVASHLQERDHLLSDQTYLNYVKLLVFVHCSGPEKLTDLQEYVWFQVRSQETDWLSYRLRLDLYGVQPDGSDSVDETILTGGTAQVEAWAPRLNEVSARVDDVSQRLERIERRLDEALSTPGSTSGDLGSRVASVEKELEDRWFRVEASLRRIEMTTGGATLRHRRSEPGRAHYSLATPRVPEPVSSPTLTPRTPR